jgi:DNA-binding transcriptional MerR regulator
MKSYSYIFNLSDEVSQLIDLMQIKVFSSKDSALSYRTINHYLEVGLINNKSEEGGWLKLSGMDLVWIRIIIDLRNFAISLDKIMELKRQVFEAGKFGKIDKTSFLNGSFEFEIASSILNRSELNLTVFQDFTYSFQDSQLQKIKTSKQLSKEAYLTIPLSATIRHIHQLVKHKLKNS